MKINEAIAFIAFENKISTPQLWLDLGCGSGLFTKALTSYLPPSSKIIAIDKDEKALRQIPETINHVVIETMVADFINEPVSVTEVDGVLMANSFHYVKDKQAFLKKLLPSLKSNAVFLLVEYDRGTSNPWVPYPIMIDDAKTLFQKFDYSNFQLLNKRQSVYGHHSMYAALVSK